MASLAELIAHAEWWAIPNPYRPTADDLIHLFRGAKCQQIPTQKNAEDSLLHLSNGVYLGPNPKSIKHWCGIFAVCMGNEVGLDLRWDLTKGKIAGSVTLHLSGKGVRPGDIAGVAAHQHHFLVTDVDEASGTLAATEGNTFNQQIVSGSRKPIAKVAYYYRPHGLT